MKELWTGAKAKEAFTRAHFEIPAGQIDGGAPDPVPFAATQHYFQVYVSELFLKDAKEWFVTIDPMAFVATQYVYDRAVTTATGVVGPKLLEAYTDVRPPQGMLFRNTPVTGLHPYQGGAVEITVILNQVPRQGNARQLLGLLESVASAVDPSTVFSTYAKLGGTLLDGVEMLLGLGGTEPKLGYRFTVNPAAGLPFTPGYHVVLDLKEAEAPPARFRVQDSRLYVEDDGTLTPYRDSDFLLFNVRQGTARDDERLLSFYPLWQTTQDLAARSEPHYWDEAKYNFNALKRAMLLSPDLTRPDYRRLREQWIGELKLRRKEAVLDGELRDGELDAGEAELAAVAERLDQIA